MIAEVIVFSTLLGIVLAFAPFYLRDLQLHRMHTLVKIEEAKQELLKERTRTRLVELEQADKLQHALMLAAGRNEMHLQQATVLSTQQTSLQMPGEVMWGAQIPRQVLYPSESDTKNND